MTQTIQRVHPDIMTPDEMREYERVLKSRFFLVRQGALGERMICRRKDARGTVIGGCGGTHTYITFMCIERPFSGLAPGLYARWRTSPALFRNDLSPDEQSRLERLDRFFGPQKDFRTSHPRLAQSMSLDDRDGDIGKLAVGILEPITRQKAEQLVIAINRRAGRDALTIDTLDQL